MTGTAMTEAEEFHKIYNLEVVAIPTHKDMIRDDGTDLVYRNEGSKFNAVIDEIAEMQELGRPVLVGTVSVEKSEVLSTMLKRRGVKHETLNAKFHEKESGIVAQAGRTGAVTIATNMAGRGTDILLGGTRRASLRKSSTSVACTPPRSRDVRRRAGRGEGGHRRGPRAGRRGRWPAHHRHRAPRQPADRQPPPRPGGRQGDPGSSRFYLSLEDDLMKGSPRTASRGSWSASASRTTSPSSRAWSGRRSRAPRAGLRASTSTCASVVEYDDVINRQRETIYEERNKVLRNEDLTETVRSFVVTRSMSSSGPTSAATTSTTGGWTLEAAVKAMGLGDEPGTSGDETPWLGSRDAIREHLLDAADGRGQGAGGRRGRPATVERLVLLRTIDPLWVEHLTEIDDMRRGIGLRGYAQQDPLNEFRREAYRLQ